MESFDGPDNTTSFKVEQGPVLLGIEGSAVDMRNGPYRAVRVFRHECGTKSVNAGVAVRMRGAGAVGYGVPLRKYQPLKVQRSRLESGVR